MNKLVMTLCNWFVTLVGSLEKGGDRQALHVHVQATLGNGRVFLFHMEPFSDK